MIKQNNRKKFLAVSLGLLNLLSSNLVSLANEATIEGQSLTSSSQSKTLSGEVISVSAGASASGAIDRGFSSDTAQVGDRGSLVLLQSVNGIPSGSRVEFVVGYVKSAKNFRFESPGEMRLDVVSITRPDGSRATLNGQAYVVTNPSETVLKGATTGDRVKKTAKKAAIGAGVGAAVGALSSLGRGGWSPGRGAWTGAAIGGGTGVAAAAVSKGEDVRINANSRAFLKFGKGSQLNFN